MIVTCEQCATQFQLDDSKVPADGIRVRCSRCKCAFFVESTQRLDAERASDLALDVLASDPPAAPPEVVDASAEDFGLEDDESDWQFKEDIAPQPAADPVADDLAAAQEAVDDLLGSSFTESLDAVASLDIGGDLRGSDLDGGRPEPSPEKPAPGALAPLPEPDEDPNAVTIDRGAATGAIPEAAPLAADPDPLPPADPVEAFGDPPADLGSPADWNFFADAEVPAPHADGPPPAAVAPAVDSGAGRAGDSTEREHRDAADLALEPDSEQVARAAWIARALSGTGWALVGLLCAYAGVVGLGLRLWPSQAEDGSGSIAGFEIASIRGRWVENVVAGPIYVVSGELRAGSSTALPADSRLRIRLLDAAGASIAAASAAVGPPMPSQRVREWNLRDLQAAQEAGALRVARRPVAPDQPWPFMAILGDLPETAAAYEFQVVAAASPAVSAAEPGYPVAGFVADGMIE